MKSAIEIAEAVHAGKMRARDVVQASLDAIAARDGKVNSFVHIDAEGALAAAHEVDARVARGEAVGALAGVPFGVKDNDAVKGMPTRQGSLLLKDAKAESIDSVQVMRLRAADAIPLGKVAMSEFGLDGVTHTIAHGTTRNPWKLDRTPAGSSGGSSAAVSAGLVPFATGSDALGSIRCPAAFTGTVGLKPTQGRIPRSDGFRAAESSLGALTMTVADTARYLDIVSGSHDRDRTSLPAPGLSYERAIETVDVRGLRAVYSADLGYAPVTDEVRAMTLDAARRFCKVTGIELVAETFSCTNAYVAWNALAARTLRAQFESSGFWPQHADKISPGPRNFIESFGTMSAHQEIAYTEVCKTLEREMAAFFTGADLLITPAACCEAYAAEGPLPTVIEGRDASETNAEPYTAVGSICFCPSMSVPAGVSRGGLPIGLLVTGRRHSDEVVLRLARLWEQAFPWPRVAPGYERD